MAKKVVLELRKGEFQQDFAVTLEIDNDNGIRLARVIGTLPESLEVAKHHENWRSAYRELDIRRRAKPIQQGRTSRNPQQCEISGKALENSMKIWFDFPQFAKIRETLYGELNKSDEIRLLIQTEDSNLRRLPWHLFFDTFLYQYTKAEVALSTPEYYQPPLLSTTKRNKVRILAVLGDSDGIDVNRDEQLLKQLLPDAETVLLAEPQPKKLHDCLWDEQGWDILFFAGHSSSDDNAERGYININKTDQLQISQLKRALKTALERGLQLAIFNSCDGLGLARNLAELHIPQIIVMREPVPDKVAQAFLKYFLTEFSGGKSLYLAVRKARERLEGLEFEAPNATWLPVIYQLPTQVPPTWQQLCRATNTPGILEQRSTVVGRSLENNPAQTQTNNKQNSPASSEPGNMRTRSSQPESPPVVTSPVSPSTQKSPQTPAPQVLPKEKNITDVIKALPRSQEYPVYQVFGVICSFCQYNIATPAEILPLCLPEYSKKAVQKVVDDAFNKELKDLVIQGRFERLGTSDKLNAQKAMQPYPPNSLEKYLTAAIQVLDATKETHQRWASYGLRNLAINGEDSLVRKILQDYPTQIQALKPKDQSPEWSIWIKIYEALLQKQPDDTIIRGKYLGLIKQYGTAEQQRSAIAETTAWLQKHPEDKSVRTRYLILIEKCGTVEQKRSAIAETTTWLQKHQQAFQSALREDAKLRTELIALLQKFINITLDYNPKTLEHQNILFSIFGSFREYLNDKHCDLLADFIVQKTFNLPIYYWVLFINAAYVFRDYKNDLDKAEQIYLQVLNAAKLRLKKQASDIQQLNQTIQYAHLNYARLLIIRQPSKPNEAIKYLGYVLADNPNHALAHLYMAQCYQEKGKKFNNEAIYSFQQAIALDKQQAGHFWYEFGCFWRDALRNRTEARKCFENSLKQKINLRACVDLAELEVQDRNFARAGALLKQGCDLERITRLEREQWRQLQHRIQTLKNDISGNCR